MSGERAARLFIRIQQPCACGESGSAFGTPAPPPRAGTAAPLACRPSAAWSFVFFQKRGAGPSGRRAHPRTAERLSEPPNDSDTSVGDWFLNHGIAYGGDATGGVVTCHTE
ncbi:hypothetical protein EVAR_84278_1 [Eumeta japonica]|uniref:Uncharacterized protein n=1 Tax=Eumeta variegata TaxID=151549 RepID=A0A4C1WUS4_EUMVA|nr:hypothetical protein EVAR_84278_1 [Eumeta japonica]